MGFGEFAHALHGVQIQSLNLQAQMHLLGVFAWSLIKGEKLLGENLWHIFTIIHFADDHGGLAGQGKRLHCRIHLVRCHGEQHADAAIEGTVHFVGGNTAGLGQPLEDRRQGPAGIINMGDQMIRGYVPLRAMEDIVGAQRDG